MAFFGDRFFATTPKGVLERIGGKWRVLNGPWGTTIRDLAMVDDVLYVASWSGLYKVRNSHLGDDAIIEDMNSYDQILSRNMQDLAVDRDGRLWVGSRAGIDVYKNGKRVLSLTPKDGLPSTDVRSLAIAPGRIDLGWDWHWCGSIQRRRLVFTSQPEMAAERRSP